MGTEDGHLLRPEHKTLVEVAIRQKRVVQVASCIYADKGNNYFSI